MVNRYVFIQREKNRYIIPDTEDRKLCTNFSAVRYENITTQVITLLKIRCATTENQKFPLREDSSLFICITLKDSRYGL